MASKFKKSSGKLQVIVGGQFGSEGKGAITAHLARTEERDLVAARVAGPNAGHTAYDDDGVKYALRSLPVASICRPDAKLIISAGSEVEWAVLQSELELTAKHKSAERLTLDPQATVIDKRHQDAEDVLTAGSTKKGIGAARADRLMRMADLTGYHGHEHGFETQSTSPIMEDAMMGGDCVQIEGTQGYGLGLHAGYYPHCTSSDARAIDFLSMAGLSPWSEFVAELEIWVVFRTYPIRIAGNSGPMYREISWETLGKRTGGHVKEEFTTVTQKRRRVGEWDQGLAMRALWANGTPSPSVRVALTFADYVNPSLADVNEKTSELLNEVELYERYLNHEISLVGTGPNTVVDLR